MYPLHAIVIPVITAAKCPRTYCCILGGNKKKIVEGLSGLAPEALACSQCSACGIGGGYVDRGWFFSEIFRFSLSFVIPPLSYTPP